MLVRTQICAIALLGSWSASPIAANPGVDGLTSGNPEPAGVRPNEAKSPSSLSIEVRPRTVFAGERVVLRLKTPPGHVAPELRWKASGGVLLWDDLAEVEWKAPAEETAVVLQVWKASSSPGPASELLLCEATIAVTRPVVEGMVWIPPGAFIRGDVRGSMNLTETKTIQNACDEPAGVVNLDGYWIDKHPVTHAAYVKFLEAAVAEGTATVSEIAVMGQFEGAVVPFYYFQSYERLVPYYRVARNAREPSFLHIISHDSNGFHIKPGWETTPVVDVSWFGAAAFARFHGKSLPSEAQWEKAARGTDQRRYPWGDWLPTSFHADTGHYAKPEPAPVGRFSPLGDSPYGVSDMLSGFFEWSNDWFNPDYLGDSQDSEPLRNPTGPFWGRAHGIRGLPYGFEFPQVSFDDTEPVSNRYSWFFEFQIGDVFANSNTTFRTALVPLRKVSP